jgi:transcriptional regulator with XRE-family HTH domain
MNEIKRISVALDDKTDELLNKLVCRKNMTVSDIVRLSIVTYSELESGDSAIDVEKLKRYSNLLYGGENIMVDIELWTSILDELNEYGSEKIWKHVETIGKMYGVQFRNIGLKDIKQTLKNMEATNWFSLKTNDNGNYTLILRAKNEGKLLKIFLNSMFAAQKIPVEIIEGVRKIIVVDKS